MRSVDSRAVNPDQLDPDPHMRACVDLLNHTLMIKTTSSCQGHDDKAYTGPHLTIRIDSAGNERLIHWITNAPYFERVADVGTVLGKTYHVVRFKRSIQGHWDTLERWLQTETSRIH